MLRNNKFKSILTNTDSPKKVLPDSNTLLYNKVLLTC